MKMNQKSFSVKPVLILSASVLLLLGSTVGSTKAALTYYSENYGVEAQVSRIGVTLNENGEKISYRDYTESSQWREDRGKLLANVLGENEKIVLGKDYKEELSVTNSGSIDSFVRMVITKYWQDADGTKDTKLSPDLIRLNCLTDNGWVMDEKASTPERTILYYTNLLTPGETTPSLSDTLQIDAAVSRKVKETITKEDENGYQTIETVYEYDGYRFYIEAEADAVQTHNAQEAIKSAWGVDVEVSEDGKTIRLR